MQQELERQQRQRQETEKELALRKEIALEKAKNAETVMQLLAVERASEKKGAG